MSYLEQLNDNVAFSSANKNSPYSKDRNLKHWSCIALIINSKTSIDKNVNNPSIWTSIFSVVIKWSILSAIIALSFQLFSYITDAETSFWQNNHFDNVQYAKWHICRQHATSSVSVYGTERKAFFDLYSDKSCSLMVDDKLFYQQHLTRQQVSWPLLLEWQLVLKWERSTHSK